MNKYESICNVLSYGSFRHELWIVFYFCTGEHERRFAGCTGGRTELRMRRSRARVTGAGGAFMCPAAGGNDDILRRRNHRVHGAGSVYDDAIELRTGHECLSQYFNRIGDSGGSVPPFN